MKVNLIKKDGIIYGYQSYPLNEKEVVDITNDELELIRKYSGRLTLDFKVIDSFDIKEAVEEEIAELKLKLKSYDYIGIKIATRRATIEEYAEEIEQMTKWANKINELEDILNSL